MRVRPGHCHRRGRWGRSDLLVQPDRCHRRMGALRSAGVHATQRCPTVAIDGWARSPTQVLSDCCHRRMGAFHSAGKYAATAARPLPSADGLATACTVRHQRQEHKLSLCTTTTAITYCVLWPAASVDRQDCWPTCASARMAQSRPSAPRGVPPPGPTMIGPRTHESHNIHADTTRPRSHTHLHILDVCAYAEPLLAQATAGRCALSCRNGSRSRLQRRLGYRWYHAGRLRKARSTPTGVRQEASAVVGSCPRP